MTALPDVTERSPADDARECTDVVTERGPGGALLAVFDGLERSGVRYCVLHGYVGYPQAISSDIDCIIDPRISADDLQLLVRGCARSCGFDIVRCGGYHIVLAGRDDRGRPSFLTFDFSTDCEFANIPLFSADEILRSRRRYANFWVPRSDFEFAAYLARTVAKGLLDKSRERRLGDLFKSDPENCQREITRFWGDQNCALIATAAASREWCSVRDRLPMLAADLRRRAIRRAPWRYVRHVAKALQNRMSRALSPPGVYLVLLGPDGAGKSSVIDALGPKLRDLFPRTLTYGFVPDFMQRILHGSDRKTDAPHALPPRSTLVSVARALLYWLPYYTFGYVGRHVELIRSALVLNDRHFIDVLVDSKRYRYGGPRWLLHCIWRLSVKPDLIVLLDAPAEILHARKQEIAFNELSRQRAAYAGLVKSVPNGYIVNAARPLDEVIDSVGELVVKHLIERQSRPE